MAGHGDAFDAVLPESAGLDQLDACVERADRIVAVAGQHKRHFQIGPLGQASKHPIQFVAAGDVARNDVRDGDKPCLSQPGRGVDKSIDALVREVGDEDLGAGWQKLGRRVYPLAVTRRHFDRMAAQQARQLRFLTRRYRFRY